MTLSQNIEANVAGLEFFIDEVILAEARAAVGVIEKEVAIRRLAGLSDEAIEAQLMADFNSKGRIFGQIETTTKAHVAGLISAASNGAQQEVYQDAGITSNLRRWVVVNRPPRVCPDCPSRQGRVETIEFWQLIGEPGSGWSVCGAWDYCLLVPVDVEMDDVVDVDL